MKNKTISVILATAMLSASFITTLNFSANAATEPTITLDTVEAKPGDTVSVKVNIENNPGMWGMDLKISYDKTNLTLTSVENGDFFQTSEWTKGNLESDTYILSYEAGGFDDITTENGLLAILNFKIGENAPENEYEIKASYNPGDIINVSFDDLEFNVVNGKIVLPVKETTHTHNLTLVEGTKESCTNEGKKTYYVCDSCDKWFEDENASVEITDKNSIIIPKVPHITSNWIEDKKPTQTEAGSQHKECTICQTIIETHIIPPLPIIFGDTNLDGALSVDDVTYLQMHIACYTNKDGSALIDETNERILASADIDQDGLLSVVDVTKLQMLLAGYKI